MFPLNKREKKALRGITYRWQKQDCQESGSKEKIPQTSHTPWPPLILRSACPVRTVPLEVPVTDWRDRSVAACLPSVSKVLGLNHSAIKQTNKKMFLLHPDIDIGELVRKH